MATIGKSIRFKGNLTGDEDIEIEGGFEGRVKLLEHQLNIGPNGRIRAELRAKLVVVSGHVTGNIQAGECIEIRSSGVVNGDLRAPRLVIQEGAVVNGDVEMIAAKSGVAGADQAPTPQPAVARRTG